MSERTVREPRGCPTPGACSCPDATPRAMTDAELGRRWCFFCTDPVYLGSIYRCAECDRVYCKTCLIDHIKVSRHDLSASAAPAEAPPANDLVARLRELATYKYQYHTIHVPAALTAAAARIESLQAEIEAAKHDIERLQDSLSAEVNASIDADRALAAEMLHLLPEMDIAKAQPSPTSEAPVGITALKEQCAYADRVARDLGERLAEKDARIESLTLRAETAERRLAVYNSGGFADADALAEKYLDLSNALAAKDAEIEQKDREVALAKDSRNRMRELYDMTLSNEMHWMRRHSQAEEQLSAKDALIGQYREALRKHAMKDCRGPDGNDWYCFECRQYWPHAGPELHAPGCLASPDSAPTQEKTE